MRRAGDAWKMPRDGDDVAEMMRIDGSRTTNENYWKIVVLVVDVSGHVDEEDSHWMELLQHDADERSVVVQYLRSHLDPEGGY